MLTSLQNQPQLTEKKTLPIEKCLKSTVSSSSLYGTDVVAEEYRQLVDSIAKHIVYGKNILIILRILIYLFYINV